MRSAGKQDSVFQFKEKSYLPLHEEVNKFYHTQAGRRNPDNGIASSNHLFGGVVWTFIISVFLRDQKGPRGEALMHLPQDTLSSISAIHNG